MLRSKTTIDIPDKRQNTLTRNNSNGGLDLNSSINSNNSNSNKPSAYGGSFGKNKRAVGERVNPIVAARAELGIPRAGPPAVVHHHPSSSNSHGRGSRSAPSRVLMEARRDVAEAASAPKGGGPIHPIHDHSALNPAIKARNAGRKAAIPMGNIVKRPGDVNGGIGIGTGLSSVPAGKRTELLGNQLLEVVQRMREQEEGGEGGAYTGGGQEHVSDEPSSPTKLIRSPFKITRRNNPSSSPQKSPRGCEGATAIANDSPVRKSPSASPRATTPRRKGVQSKQGEQGIHEVQEMQRGNAVNDLLELEEEQHEDEKMFQALFQRRTEALLDAKQQLLEVSSVAPISASRSLRSRPSSSSSSAAAAVPASSSSSSSSSSL